MKVVSIEEMNKYKQYLLEDKTEEALTYLRSLYNKYPSDSRVLFHLGTLLLKMKRDISDAFFYLKLASNSKNIDGINNEIGLYYLSIGDFISAEDYFSKISKSNEKNFGYKLNGLLKVYLHTEEYDRAYGCCRALNKLRSLGIFDIEHLNNTYIFILNKIGRYHHENSKYGSIYYSEQMISYSPERTIKHIEEHKLKDTSENYKSENSLYQKRVHSLFNDEVDVTELYNKCSELIANRDPNSYSYVDYYKLELENTIGETYNGYKTNCVEVVTFPASKQILTIYPGYINHINKKVTLEEVKPKRKNYDYKKKLKKKPKK